MTDVNIGIPTKEPEGKIEQANQEGVSVIVENKAKTENDPAPRQWKGKYNGRSKKRSWEFNRRDDNVKRVRTDPEDRVKRRKFLLVIGYAGANYVGMQRNPGVNTIEEELLKAMFKNKLILEDAFNQPQYIHFQRAARTDKGVSAARQCISLKLRK